MSLISISNSKDPTTDPWGTPTCYIQKRRFSISYFSALKPVVQVRSK